MRTETSFLRLIVTAALMAALITMAMLSVANAQTGNAPKSGSDLYAEIIKLDSILFNAFNKRDTTLFKQYFTQDLEFFHDKTGLTGYDNTISFMRNTARPGNDLKRELVEGSSEVYPVPGYGAMQIGKHRFCHTENGKYGCGTFKFVHIWQYKNARPDDPVGRGQWKISRIVSYDH